MYVPAALAWGSRLRPHSTESCSGMCRHPAREPRHRGRNLQSRLGTLEKRQIPTSEKAQAVTFWPQSHAPFIVCSRPPASLGICQLASLTRSPPAWLLSWVPLCLCPPTHPPGLQLPWPNQPCVAVDHVPTRHCAHPQVQTPLTPVHTQCLTRYFCVCTSAQRVLTRKGLKRIVKQTCMFVRHAEPVLSKEQTQGQGCHHNKATTHVPETLRQQGHPSLTLEIFQEVGPRH